MTSTSAGQPAALTSAGSVAAGSQEDYWRSKDQHQLSRARSIAPTYTNTNTAHAIADTRHTLFANLIETITASYEKKDFLFE